MRKEKEGNRQLIFYAICGQIFPIFQFIPDVFRTSFFLAKFSTYQLLLLPPLSPRILTLLLLQKQSRV